MSYVNNLKDKDETNLPDFLLIDARKLIRILIRTVIKDEKSFGIASSIKVYRQVVYPMG